MRRPGNKSLIAEVAAIVTMAAGCSVLSPQEDHSRYFVLTPSANSDVSASAGVATAKQLSVGLGPITLPQYLERPQVVTRLSDTEFSVSDNDRWGEPLDASVSRVLAEDLASDLPNSQIVAFPWSRKTRIDCKVTVDFRRLERTADGNARVQAIWTIRTGTDNQLVQTGTTTSIGSAGNDQSSASAALSHGIGQLSRDIARSIRKGT
jgi:uncharacterized lipoprotein YmbA